MTRPAAPDSPPLAGQRIVIIGVTASGKTTLARDLAVRLGCPHIELDALHWEPGWVEAALDVFRARTAQAVAGERWVLDGNYSKVRDIVWPRADALIWLDYPFPIVLWRLTGRTLRRLVTREELWNGNHEQWRNAFLSRNSLFWWMITTYRRRKREYPVLLAQPEYAHLHVIRLATPRAASAWLERV